MKRKNISGSKEGIRLKDDQQSDIEHDRLIEHRKRIGQNDRQDQKLTRLPYMT